MKRCPVCQRVYEDEMGFCLEDGSGLMSISEPSFDAGATVKIPASRLTDQSPTEILPAGEFTQPAPQFARQHYASERTVATERKPSALPWILGAAIVLGLSGIVIALILTRNRELDNPQIAQNTSQSANTTPTLESGNTATVNAAESRESAPPFASDTPGTPPADRDSAQASPTPGRMQTPRGTPATVSADEPPPPPPPKPTPTPRLAPISGGVLNGKAISLPKPQYPAIARAARASGTVTVQVTIDESGKVISARAVGGHPLLQQAAVQAAYGARFSPTQLSGQPVKVTGVITYNFVAQ
jgi:TonB family protein